MSADSSDPPISIEDAAETTGEILTTLSDTVVATDEFFETILTGFLAGEHVLIEDVPGTGKTLTARSLAAVLGLQFNRIQFTPDLLPSDITGSIVFDEASSEFSVNRGPIFSNIVLADEINRAPPKTQAALLEAMEEKQVSLGSDTFDLPEPFIVIATQNPVEQEGTFALPESQRDRFMIKTAIGYPDEPAERTLLDRRIDRRTAAPTVDQLVEADTLGDLQALPEYIHVDPKIRDYIVAIGRATREHRATAVGVSPRGIQRHMEAARARAVIQGRDYVVPADVKFLARPVLAHRLVLTSAAMVEGISRASVIEDTLESIEVPAMDAIA